MSNSLYYLLCLAGGLLLIAAASAAIAWREERRAMRQHEAARLLDLLACCTEWVAAQRQAVCFQAPAQESESGVGEIAASLRRWYPELGAQAESLADVHARLQALLREHHRQRARDPEAALEAGRDAAFLALWRQHCALARELEQRLVAVASAPSAPPHVTLPS